MSEIIIATLKNICCDINMSENLWLKGFFQKKFFCDKVWIINYSNNFKPKISCLIKQTFLF